MYRRAAPIVAAGTALVAMSWMIARTPAPFHGPGVRRPLPAYDAPSPGGLFATDGDSFVAAGGGQSWTSPGTYLNSVGNGTVYTAELYGRSGGLVMPSETYQKGVSGQTPYGMALKAVSNRTDSGTNMVINGATIAAGTPTTLTLSGAANGGAIWPNTVFTLSGSASTATVTSLGATFGGPGNYTISNANGITGSGATFSAVANPAFALGGGANTADEMFSINNNLGGAFVDAAANVINFENAHNGRLQSNNFAVLDQYFRAAGPAGATIGADPANYPGYNWAGWPSIYQAGQNYIVIPDDNYLGDVIFYNQTVTAAASVTPAANAGLNISSGVVSQYFSDVCAGYPATFTSNIWSGNAYNATPVIFFGGANSEAPILGTRVGSNPAKGQYTLTLTKTSAKYGFSAADISNGTQVLLTYCSAPLGYVSGLELKQYLDYAGYYVSTASNYVGVGTGVNYQIPGAAYYPWVHPALTFEASEDPAALNAGYLWPIPILYANSGGGNHVSPYGTAVMGKVVGSAIAAALPGAGAIWTPQKYNNLQVWKTKASVNAISDVLPQSIVNNISLNGVEFIIINGSVSLVASAAPGIGTQSLSGPGISWGCINITAGGSCNGSSTVGAWFIMTSSPIAANAVVYFYGATINPRPGPPANGQGPNLLINGSMAYDACGSGAGDSCGGNVTAAGGTLSGWTGSGAVNPACNSSGPGTLGGNFIPQGYVLYGNTSLGEAISGGTLAINCGYTASDPAGNPAFWIDVEGYAAAGSAFNLSQKISIPSQSYLRTATDKARGYLQYVITAGSMVQSDGANHIFGANSPAITIGATVPAGTIYGRPCNSKSSPGGACTISSAECQANASSIAGNLLIDAALIDGATTPYLMEKCLTPPAPLFSDAGAGTASTVTWKMIFPFEVNVPTSYRIYVEDAEVHVAAF
jgi:hypothetical protein